MNNNKQKGFTLIEMLVVIGIIGLLSAVVVVGLAPARQEARDARRIADINQLANWMEINYNSSTGYDTPAAAQLEVPGEYNIVVSVSGHNYNMGIRLERDSNDNFDASICPSGVSAPAFCVSQ